MKIVTIQVSEEFVVPPLFSDAGSTCSQRELALSIGAKAVQDLSESRQHQDGYSCQLLSKIGELESDLRTARQSLEDQRTSIDAELKKAKEEKCRETFLAEKEALVARLEERHSAALMLAEKRHNERLQEQKEALAQLRTEHEGLVLKLMSRLETTRVGLNAPALGRAFEENVERHLRQAFGAREGFQLEDVHTTGHRGDLLMVFDSLRVLIELKSYDPKTKVPTKEVEKLARDLSEVEPRCQAAIMISACSEITGHYACGPLEVSASVACVPVLFINNFLSLGEPQVTLHMTRVFLSMIQVVRTSVSRIEQLETVSSSDEIIDRLRTVNSECARRCTSYLTDLSRQSADLLHQATAMKNGAIKLRETVVVMIENEISRFNGIIHLMSHGVTAQEAVSVDVLPELDISVFADPASMSPALRDLASRISVSFAIGDPHQRCTTKDMLDFIQAHHTIKTQKAARDALKAIFLDSVVKHGYIVGVAMKALL